MPGFSSKRRAYRRILETDHRKATKDRMPIVDKKPPPVIPVDVKQEGSKKKSERGERSVIPLDSAFFDAEPLAVPRSRKLCHWKPNVSTVFEDNSNSKQDVKKGEHRPCRFISSMQEYLAAWLVPKQC